jgi:hypothetical protein
MTKISFPKEEIRNGGHRATLYADFTPGLQQLIYDSVASAVRHQHFLGGMTREARLEVFSFSPSSTALSLHLVGNLDWWRVANYLHTLSSNQDPFAPLRPAHLILENAGLVLQHVTIESRVIEGASYERTDGNLGWPWPTARCFGDATTIRPRGVFSPSQLAVLADAVQHHVRISNTIDFSLPAARIDGDTIVLAMSTPRSLLVAAVYVWTQVCWVDLEALDFD